MGKQKEGSRCLQEVDLPLLKLKWTLRQLWGETDWLLPPPLLCPPITFLQTWKMFCHPRRGKDGCCRTGNESGRAGPSGSGRTDVGWLALGRELTNANYWAKLLAKYVSPCHIRLLRGRFIGQKELCLLRGGHLKGMDANYWICMLHC